MIEGLSTKCEALNSKLSTSEKQNRKGRKPRLSMSRGLLNESTLAREAASKNSLGGEEVKSSLCLPLKAFHPPSSGLLADGESMWPVTHARGVPLVLYRSQVVLLELKEG
jgi:hypothetical protein